MKMRASIVCFSLWVSLLTALPANADNAAHELANKFSGSGGSAAASENDGRGTSYEADMLERARQEAAERSAAEADAAVEADNRRKELEAERAAEARALAEKLKRVEEARKAKSAEIGAERPFKPALTRSDKDANSAPGPARIVVTPPPIEPPAQVAKDAAPFAQSPEPTPLPLNPLPVEAGPHVAGESIKREQIPVSPPMALGREIAAGSPEPSSLDPRVTVLLVMEPGNKGIRRFNKTADPILCEGDVCFISTGAASAARTMPMRKALGPGNTFGQRAGACRSKLGCVFRGVTLAGTTPTIQPVDLKVLVHDRREPRAVSGDSSCRVTGGRLSCGRTVVAPGYRAWIIPEVVAESAGASILEMAVARGLYSSSLREAAARH